MKRLALLLLALVCLLSHPPALADASFLDQRSIQLTSGYFPSYAWNSRYLFAAYGFSNGDGRDVPWTAGDYEIVRIDRQTGTETILMDDFPSWSVHLIAEEDALYVVSRDVRRAEFLNLFGEADSEETVYIVRMSPDGRIEDSWKIAVTDALFDAYVWTPTSTLYLITGQEVVAVNLDTRESVLLYRGHDIQNTSQNRAGIDRGKMYVLDGTSIVAVDIESGETRTVYRHLSPSLNLPTTLDGPQYIVLDGMLYLWNDALRKTIAVTACDPYDHEVRVISDDRFFFQRYSPEGICAYRLSPQALQTLYESRLRIGNGFLELCSPDNSLYGDLMFYPFSDPDAPTFSPDQTAPAPVVLDWTLFLLDQNQCFSEEDISKLSDGTDCYSFLPIIP